LLWENASVYRVTKATMQNELRKATSKLLTQDCNKLWLG